jgi:uncharacterized protein (TIGR02145 family)
MKLLLKIAVAVLFLAGLITIMQSCKKKATLPVLTTLNVSEITRTSAVSGGKITSDGGAEVTSRGVYWSTDQYPTASSSKTTDGNGTGTFVSNLTGLTPGTKYYVRAYANNSEGTGYGNSVSFTTSDPLLLATITTASVTAVTTTSAMSGGNISSDGGSPVTARGICWGKAPGPDINGSHSSDGSGTGSFPHSITELVENTGYYVRAYAINSVGIVYGNELFFKTQQVKTVADIEGNIYQYMTIGTQIWMTENLRTTKYRNGDPIPTGLGDAAWTATVSGAYTVYNNDNSNDDIFGKLYNWYAVTDSRHICPAGWHEPSDAEWKTLETYLTTNGYGFGGSGNDIAKSMSATYGWGDSGLSGSVGNDQTSNNSSGFSALPGGFRHYEGFFDYVKYIGFWWTSSGSESGSDYAWSRYLQNNSTGLNSIQYDKNKGLSVRCIKD